jgi:SAM-dependent methyltransferase
MSHRELQRIHERYQRRTVSYDPWSPWVYQSRHELERAMITALREAGMLPAGRRRLLDIGCGSGGNLLYFLRLGFAPENLVGCELQTSRAREARDVLPSATRVEAGDASSLVMADSSCDVVFQSLVFSSILDDALQVALADRMWRLVRPGGGVLWYDFTYNNPSNPDVRGVQQRRIRQLFPDATMRAWRVTLAPPISRRVCRIHPAAYSFCNALPFLRTHLLCWLAKAGR